MPGDRSAETAYSASQAQDYDERRFTSKGGQLIHEEEFGQVRRFLETLPKDARILEIGCGTGRLLTEGRDLGFHIDGTDASAAMLDEVRLKSQTKYPDLELKMAGAADLPWESEHFDGLYAVRLLNQTESPEYALKVVEEMIRLASDDGGRVLVEFINKWRPRVGLNRQATVRLTAADVIATGTRSGATFVSCRGSFFLGMVSYRKSPDRLLPLVRTVDRALARMLPRLCSRVYVEFRKGGG